MCELLVEALQPLDYKVLTCSTFAESPLSPPKPQVAILSKRTAYFTWSGPWATEKHQKHSEEVAFAAVQSGTQRLGFLTALFDQETSGQQAGQSLLEQINAVRHWETNQVQTFVVGASFNTLSRTTAKALYKMSRALDGAGLVDASETLSPDASSTGRSTNNRADALADALSAGPMGFPTNVRITTSPRFEHNALTCDLELDPDKVTLALDLFSERWREKEAQTGLETRKVEYAVGAALSTGLIVGLGVWIRRRKRPHLASAAPRRLPASTLPSKAPSPLRPIIQVQAPKKVQASGPLPLLQATRPVLRLQSSSRLGAQPATQRVPTPPHPLVSEPTRTGQSHDSVSPEQTLVPPQHRAPVVAGIEDPVVRQGLVKELSAWLKQKFVRKLVTDRAQLMEAHQIAARMATTLDSRLARIEGQIQQQNQAYVRRIEELNKELAAAREENRELIRERIAQVKAEMEAARARLLAEANLDNTSLRL